MRIISFMLVLAVVGIPAPANACEEHAPGAETKHRPAAQHSSSFVAGAVREVDVDDGTITLAHGRIASLRKQPMSSMV